MTSDTIELVERVRRRLKEHESPCLIAGPAEESAISAAEAALAPPIAAVATMAANALEIEFFICPSLRKNTKC